MGEWGGAGAGVVGVAGLAGRLDCWARSLNGASEHALTAIHYISLLLRLLRALHSRLRLGAAAAGFV